jgi:hypothetical protein
VRRFSFFSIEQSLLIFNRLFLIFGIDKNHPNRVCPLRLQTPKGITMKAFSLIVVFAIILIATTLAAPLQYGDIPVTRWVDPQGRTPMSYQEYIRNHPMTPVSTQRLGRFSPAVDTEIPVVLLVEETLYPDISASIATFVSDLVNDDFDVLLVQWGGGSPEELKDSLMAWWNDELIEGAVLVGDLPVPWFELYEDFDDDSIPDNPYMVQFPCDLFYMDMDGNWEDEDQDSIYDLHSGDTDAEIWVGQLRAAELSQSEAISMNNYFAKNHAYRQGTLILPNMALNYIDDDWYGSAHSWASTLGQAIGAVHTINQPDTTTANRYLVELHQGYSFTQVAVHSSPFVHAFKENNGTTWGYIQNWEIRNTDPESYFYNLFACSNCRYVEDDYMGGWYVFGDTYGLQAVGSTKTGAMLFFEDYYPILGNMGTVGEALAHWFNQNGNIPGHQMWSRSWFYGMTNLGDPTLRIPLTLRVSSMEIDDDSLGASLGDGDGMFDAGERIELSLEVDNPMSNACLNVTTVLSSSDTCITLIDSSAQVPSIPPEGSASFSGYVMEASPFTRHAHISTINMTMTDYQGRTWYDSFMLGVAAPFPQANGYQITEVAGGNGNGWADPGETVDCNLLVQNIGGETARELTATMGLISGNATILNSEVNYGDLPPDSSAYSTTPFRFSVSELHPNQEALFFEIKLLSNNREVNQNIIAVPMSLGYDATFTFESQDPAVKHYAVAEDYQDAWHWSTQYAHNGNGSQKFGDTGEGNYPPMADGALEFPLFPVGGSASLTVWHKIDAEVNYDGGIVEINTGDEWTLIYPDGGYPYTAGNNGSFPAYTPCFSGTEDWSEEIFNLPPAAGFAKIRFRFGSDGGVEELGWFVDDVTFDSPQVSVGQETATTWIPGEFALLPSYPNPFNACTRINFTVPAGWNHPAELAVFNILGQKVNTLWTGVKPGAHSIIWTGSDLQGRPVGSGIYFIHLKSHQTSLTQKLVLLR